MLPNPHWKKDLRLLTGLDAPVQAFLDAQPLTGELFTDIAAFLDRWLPRYASASRSYLTIAVGCTGGQHRSVYLAERLAAHLRRSHGAVHLRHREMQ